MQKTKEEQEQGLGEPLGVKTSPRVPKMLTQQVIVGLMNDILSSCTFRTLPEVPGVVVNLNKKIPASNRTYMLVLRFEKKGVSYEVLSHGFGSKTNDDGPVGGHSDESRPTQISIGLVAAIMNALKEPTPSSSVPLSILNGYLTKHINRGGMWAYMSLPGFLGSASTDDKVTKARRLKSILANAHRMAPISATTIVSLLWSLNYLKADALLSEVCRALVKEFLTCHKDAKKLVYVLYMGSTMGILSHEEVVTAAKAHLNHVSILNKLTERDLLLLLASFSEEYSFDNAVVKKVLLIAKEDLELYHPMCVASLLWLLVKMGYRFDHDAHFTQAIMKRLGEVIYELPVGMSYLFSALAFIPCDLCYYDVILGSIMLKLHLMDQKDIIMIGASYAFASKLISTTKKAKYEEPMEDKMYHCLKNHVEQLLYEGLNKVEVLQDMVAQELLSDPSCYFTEKIAETIVSLPREPISNATRKGYHRGSTMVSTTRDTGPAYVNSAVPKVSNTHKLFYLNLLEDSCLRYEQLDFDSLCCLAYAMLAVRMDVTPLHQAMLVTQGLMLHKPDNPVNVDAMAWTDTFEQYSMIYEFLQCAQSPDHPENPLVIGDTELHCEDILQNSECSDVNTDEASTPTVGNTPKIIHEQHFVTKPSAEAEGDKHRNAIPEEHVVASIEEPPSARKTKADMLEMLAALTYAIAKDEEDNHVQIEEILRRYHNRDTHSISGNNREGEQKGSDNYDKPLTNEQKESHDEAATESSNALGSNTSLPTSNLVNKDQGTTGEVNGASHSIRKSRGMFQIRTIRYHRVALVERELPVSNTHVKANGVAK